MEHTTFSHLSDAEFLSHVEATRDPLTTTTVEIELLQRLRAAADFDAGERSLLRVLDEFNSDEPGDLRTRLEACGKYETAILAAIVEALDEAGIEDAAELASRLKAAERLGALADAFADALPGPGDRRLRASNHREGSGRPSARGHRTTP